MENSGTRTNLVDVLIPLSLIVCYMSMAVDILYGAMHGFEGPSKAYKEYL